MKDSLFRAVLLGVIFFIFYGWRLLPSGAVWPALIILAIIFWIVAAACVWETREDKRWQHHYELNPLRWDEEKGCMVPLSRECPRCEHKLQARDGHAVCKKCGYTRD